MLVLQTDSFGIIKDINANFCHISGYDKNELIGKKSNILSSGFQTDDFYKNMWDTISSADVWQGEIQNVTKDGKPYWLDMKIIPLLNTSKEITAYISISNDVTSLKKAHNRLDNIISSTHDIIYTMNGEGIFQFVSPSWTDLLGHELNEVVNHSFVPFVHTEDVPKCAEYLNKVLSKNIEKNESVIYRVFHKDGTIRYHQSRASVLEESPQSIKFLAIASDITQSVRQEKEIQDKNRELEKLATIDYLTGLFNRVKIDEILKYELYQFGRYKSTFGIIMLDIDYFKSVNDMYGHQVGDEILIELSQELLDNSRQSDSVGRWGGEEFLIISPNIDEKGLLVQAEYIKSTIEKHTFSIGQKTVSIGVSLVKEDDEVHTLIQRADEALYDAKRSGRNRVCLR